MTISGNQNIAVFSDGESLHAASWPAVQKALTLLGQPGILRVYGDFSNPSHSAWLPVCLEYGMEPVLHMPLVCGKNGTDMLIAIAVMDLIHGGFSGMVVLGSNDRDFLPLARRVRMSGTKVCGLALRAATTAETSVYHHWCPLDLPTPKKAQLIKDGPQKPASTDMNNGQFLKTLRKLMGTQGEMSLSEIGSQLAAGWPELHKSLGKNKLKARIVKDAPEFAVEGNRVRKV